MTEIGLVLVKATNAPLPCPEPGIYPDVDADTYHRWDAASASRLKLLRRSAAHLKDYLDHGREDTDAFRIGRAFHAAVLEPDTFADRWPVAARCSAITKTKSQCSNSGLSRTVEGQWVCGTHGGSAGGQFLKASEHADIILMRDGVLRHPRARKLFTGKGQNELSIVWDDAETGVRCKARIDRHHPTLTPGGCIGDLKSTRDASARQFERSAYDTGIYMQGAMYLTGANANGLASEHFAVIACEKESPYCVAVFVLTPGALSAGEEQMKTLLRTYKQCKETDHWPGYAEAFQPLDLPHYAYGQVDEEVDATP